MKKIMYSLFVFILLVFGSTSILKVSASSNDYNYAGLTKTEKVYYNALKYMYDTDMFLENKTLDLVEANFISDQEVSKYVGGSNDIFVDFNNAKEAFFLDYEEIYYIDIDKMFITVYQNEESQIFIEIGSGIYETYLNVKEDVLSDSISEYDARIAEIAKQASKHATIEEKIAYLLSQTFLDTPQKIKSVLDELNIDNFIYNHFDNFTGQEILLNFYFQGEYYVEFYTAVAFSQLAESTTYVSRPLTNYTALESNKVQLLETKNESNETLKLVPSIKDEVLDLPDVYAYTVYQLNFYQDDLFVYELENSQMVLLPFPTSFAYGSTDIEYDVKVFNEETSLYKEIDSVTTVLGLVCEINSSAKVLVEAHAIQEETTTREFVILVSAGGSSSVNKIAKIEDGKNIKINVTADQHFIVEKISVDGKFVKFKPEAEFLYALNYEEVKDGSIVIIDFINENKYSEDKLQVVRTYKTCEFEITGSHYAYIGGKPRFTIAGEYAGNAVFEWYFEGTLIARTTDPHFSFGPMLEENRGNYKAKVIVTNGLMESVFETEDFKLYDSHSLEEDPFPFTIILCGILFLGFIAFAIFDNASFKQVDRKKS